MRGKITLTAFEGLVVGDAEVLEHVRIAGERGGGEGQEDGGGGEEYSWKVLGRHGQMLL